MIKPAKSYTYFNREGPPLTVTTYEKSNTRFKLRNGVVTELDELGEHDYFRHLSNVQNARGHTPTEPMVMYDGSKQENILAKVNKSMAALSVRNITIGDYRRSNASATSGSGQTNIVSDDVWEHGR
jgi:hypothetical protein